MTVSTRLFRFSRSTICLQLVVFMLGVSLSTSTIMADTKLFLLGGQSNMDGRPYASNIPAPYDQPQTEVKIWDGWLNDGWHDLEAGYTESGKQYGPEVSFGKAMHELYPNDDIYLVKYADGGTSLANHWNPDGTGARYNTFKTAADAAIQNLINAGHTPKICGMLWMQGESDALNHDYAVAYENNLKNFIAEVRDDFNTPDMPFVLGRITTYFGSYADNAVVRNAQLAVAGNLKNVSWFNTDDLSWVGAYAGHYGTEGQIILGQRFASEIEEIPEPNAVVLLATGLCFAPIGAAVMYAKSVLSK